jgi:hypothetical protein
LTIPHVQTLLPSDIAPPAFGWATADDTFGEGTGQDITADWPANMGTDDIVIAAVATDFQHDFSSPSGFSTMRGTTASLGARLRWCWRRIDGTESATFTINMVETTDVHRAWRVIRVPLAHATEDVPNSTNVFGTSGTVDPGSISPAWGMSSDSLIVVMGCTRGPTTNPIVTSYSSGYANGIEHGSYLGGARHVLYLESRIINATSEDPGSISLAQNLSRVACTTAIRAA